MRNDDEPSLFFWQNQMFSLRELQQFLSTHSFSTVLLNGQLTYQDKVAISLKKDKQNRNQLKLVGNLC